MTEALLSFDVEDWFHAHNVAPAVDRTEWDDCESRVGRNTGRILDLLEEHEVRATFFVLGWIADRYPDVVKRIAARGHEIASHGYNHKLLYEQTDAELRQDLRRSLEVLEPLTDEPIRGYRAPSFSITDRAADLLSDLGFEYDSSSFAVTGHDRYGGLSLSSDPEGTVTRLSNGLIEVQLPKLDLPVTSIPWAGGGYFRFIPYAIYRRGVDRILDERDFVFYLHPWELDPDQPRQSGLPLSYRIRHYTNLDRTADRLGRLLDDFDWKPISEAV
jgi:polysaccharide deacetylase family protein (PEP-CTERM system associated)